MVVVSVGSVAASDGTDENIQLYTEVENLDVDDSPLLYGYVINKDTQDFIPAQVEYGIIDEFSSNSQAPTKVMCSS